LPAGQFATYDPAGSAAATKENHTMTSDPTDLSTVKLFAGLPAKELRRIEADLTEVRQPAGKEIMVVGADGMGFMVILEGEAEVSTADGRTRKLQRGDHFGEMALLDEKGRSASVRTLTDVRLAGVVEWTFKEFLAQHPEVAWRLLQTFSERLREAESS
jgi:CRP-like cAMP-binding protein